MDQAVLEHRERFRRLVDRADKGLPLRPVEEPLFAPPAKPRPKMHKGVKGMRFNRLYVEYEVERPAGHKSRWWLCTCDCGTKLVVCQTRLKQKTQQSCGCYKRDLDKTKMLKHGNIRNRVTTPEYRAWLTMKANCNTPSASNYPEYGGRGIKVFSRWQKDFLRFLMDVGKRPTEKHHLIRRNRDGDFTPANCVWMTPQQNEQLHPRSPKVEVNGVSLTVPQWSRRSGIPYTTLRHRTMKMGWTWERAVTTPLRKAKGRTDSHVAIGQLSCDAGRHSGTAPDGGDD